MGFGKKLKKAFRKYTPAGLMHKGFNHVRHKIGLDAKHLKPKIFSGSAVLGSYDTGYTGKTLAQLTTRR